MPSSRRRNGRSSSVLTPSRGTSTLSGTSQRTSEGQRSKRRPPATLEQRRQVRYLARRHPHLNPNQIVKIVDCSYSAVSKILTNTFAGGDINPDELPHDKDFLGKFGTQGDSEEAGLAVSSKYQVGPRKGCAGMYSGNEPEQQWLGSPLQVSSSQNKGELEWVSEFFNSRNPAFLNLPTSVIQELVAAGFKEHTIFHLMGAYTDKRELSGYLATVLRVTPIERDVIAGLMMESKHEFFHMLKQEEYD